MKIFFLRLLTGLILFTPSYSYGTEISSITSIKHLEIVDGRGYVAFGYPKNRMPFQKELKRLWETSPEINFTESRFRRPYKVLSVEEIKSVMGGYDEYYIVVTPKHITQTLQGRCKNWKENCAERLAGLEFKRVKVVGAALYQWGCDGSIIPVLDLGPWSIDSSLPVAPQSVALGSKSILEIPEHLPLNTSRYPKNITQKFLLNYDGFFLRFGNESHLYSIIYYTDMSRFLPHFWLINPQRDDQYDLMYAIDSVNVRC